MRITICPVFCTCPANLMLLLIVVEANDKFLETVQLAQMVVHQCVQFASVIWQRLAGSQLLIILGFPFET